MTALAADGQTVYAGGAAGGVWRSFDGGQHWTPVFDQQDNLSIGALAINPADHSIWVGTGEPNTSADSYSGDGIYRSGNDGRTWRLVGGALPNDLVYQLTFDGQGRVYAATSQGLLRRWAANLHSPWTTVLKPDPNPDNSPYRTSFITDVKVQPGTNGKVVIAPLGWRGGTLPADTSFNGFYESTDSGRHFSEVTPTGDLAGATDLGRTTFAYSSDGHVLYALIESSATVALKGVYESASGNLAGPWTLIADSTKLAELELSAGAVGRHARTAGVVQPGAHRRPEERRASVRRPRRGLRDRQLRRHLDHDRPLLELPLPVLERRSGRQHLPAHGARRPARAGDQRRYALHRRRRRRLLAPAQGRWSGEVARPERHPAHA